MFYCDFVLCRAVGNVEMGWKANGLTEGQGYSSKVSIFFSTYIFLLDQL